MIDLPRRIAEEMHPLSVEEITRILGIASYRKKGLYLALLYSGMRIGEAVQVRKRDVGGGPPRILLEPAQPALARLDTVKTEEAGRIRAGRVFGPG